MSSDIARRLRAVREAHGLSQRQLARRAGVSNATVSLIEHGRTNPSLGMLKRILDAVPLSMGAFFAEAESSPPQVFFGRDELVEIGSGPISYRQVGGHGGERRLQVLHETYAPGADTGQSMLRHDGEEAGLILSGLLEVTVGGQIRVLRAGEAYQFDSRVPHRFRNPGREPCVLVSACTPPTV